MVALGINCFNSVTAAICHVGLFWLAPVYGQLIRGIPAWHRSLPVSSHLSCRPLLASVMHALIDFWIVAIPAGSASFMYTEFKITSKICAFQYVCNELVIEYSLVQAYYLEAFPYILCCAYVNSCSLIEPQFPVLLFS